MRKSYRYISIFLMVVILITALIPSAFAKDFAPKIDAQNLGVQTQYLYNENNPSWIRELTIKEDMLSSQSLASGVTLQPVTDYPFIIDAPGFDAQVKDYAKTFTLDEDQQKAAYIYLLRQIGALTIISEPTTSNETKADWLRKRGIVITEEDESNPDKVLMISALYALMRNDFYYVLKGKHLKIPEGTPLEEALVTYIMAISGQHDSLIKFLKMFMDKVEIGSLDDYIFYTALFALYTNGYISASEIPGILNGGEAGRKEVYRRMAIMTIRTYGIAIDGDNASPEEIQHKYLTAMLGVQYKVSLSPEALERAKKQTSIAYYILQRMAFEDANITISDLKYNYNECFEIVLSKTTRFNLKNEFYSDIYEYNIFLKHNRKDISIKPELINNKAHIKINGFDSANGKYNVVSLKNVEKQPINIQITSGGKGNKKVCNYTINVHQGTVPSPDSDLTEIIPLPHTTIIGDIDVPSQQNPDGNVNPSSPAGVEDPLAPTNSVPATGLPGQLQGPDIGIATEVNSAASGLLNNILTLNEDGKLVNQQGQIISQTRYKKLPAGYQYVQGPDGIIQVIVDEKLTEKTTENIAEKERLEKEKKIKMAIIILAVILFIIIIVTLIFIKHSKIPEAEKMKKRKQRELKKKAKKNK